MEAPPEELSGLGNAFGGAVFGYPPAGFESEGDGLVTLAIAQTVPVPVQEIEASDHGCKRSAREGRISFLAHGSRSSRRVVEPFHQAFPDSSDATARKLCIAASVGGWLVTRGEGVFRSRPCR